MIRRAPSHLVLRRNVYHFRLTIPSDLRPRLGRNEFRVSLRTALLPEARPIARRMASIVYDLFRALRKGAHPLNNLTDERIQAMAHQWLREALENEYEHLLSPGTPRASRTPEDRTEALDHAREQALEDLLTKDFRRVARRADALIDEAGMDVDKNGHMYRKLCDALLRAEADFYTLAAKPYFKGSAELAPTTPPSFPGVYGPGATQHGNSTLSDAVEKYIKVKTQSGDWRPASVKAIPPILREFITLIEYKAGKGCSCNALDRDLVRAYGTMLTKLPSGRTKMPQYRAKGISVLLKANVPDADRPSPKTLKNKYTAVRTFLTWAKDEGYLFDAESLKRALKDPKRAQKNGESTVAAFTMDELTKLFHSEEYKNDTHKQAFQHWLPLMGLFTGARIEELCQLYIRDIRQDDSGVWYFDINDNDDRNLKTTASNRQTPIHPFLIKAGLLERVAHLSKLRHAKLFPQLKPVGRTGKYSDAPSKWFTRYRRESGVEDIDERGKRKRFHSFRHTFITHCKYKGIDRRMVKEMVGHEPGQLDDVTDGYEDQFFISQAFEQGVSRLDFDEQISLAHLCGSKWIRTP